MTMAMVSNRGGEGTGIDLQARLLCSGSQNIRQRLSQKDRYPVPYALAYLLTKEEQTNTYIHLIGI